MCCGAPRCAALGRSAPRNRLVRSLEIPTPLAGRTNRATLLTSPTRIDASTRHVRLPHLRPPPGRPGERQGRPRPPGRPQGRREGIPPGHPQGPDREDPPPAGPRVGADQRAHHHRLLRGADRARHAAVPAHLGAAAVPLRPAQVRLPPPGRRAALGDQHAVRHQGRGEHPDRRVRQVERRHDEDRLPARPRPPLRSRDAGHLGRALQLLVPRALLAGLRRPLQEPRRGPGLPLRQLLRAAAQLPPPRLDRPLSLRQLAGDLSVVPAGPQGGLARGVRPRQSLRAVRDVAAHERPRLPQQEPGGARRLGEQRRSLHARPDAGDHDAASPTTKRSA